MPYTPILGTLGYVRTPDRRQVLLIHRNQRLNDPHSGKYNGLGGKLEPNEDIVAGMCRELREEANIITTAPILRGTISWPGFGAHGEDWFGFIFRIDEWSGEPPSTNPEGSLVWMDIGRLRELPLWEGDRFFLPLVFADEPKQFHGVMPYENGRPVSWSYHATM
jgi:8-oxo-dGTP diphosphatase